VEEKKKKKRKKRQYFTLETQEKIILYQNTSNKRQKNKIYEQHIMPAFNELVHSLVSVYKFKSPIEDINHLKSDCSTFLYETIHKWNPDKGTKAFSYFNVVAKNWLTINTRRLAKHANRSVSLSDADSMSSADKRRLSEHWVEMSPEDKERKENFPNVVNDMLNYIEEKLKCEKDIRCIKAIRQIFNNVDDLDYLNKRAVFVYLREISGLNSPELSSSLSTIRKHYRKIAGPGKDFELF
jgi:hypothetical protein